MKSSIALTALLACAAALPALAQQYPARPVRFITVGADDAMPRLVAQELAAPLGQQVYVEDHPGASGTIGAEVAARAAPDGYSFMVATTTHMVTPHFYKLSYDFQRDFEPVTLMATSPFVLLAHPALPVRSLQDLIKLARANPGKLNYSATATGSTTMLSCELFKATTGVNITHVPYKSVGAALVDALAGQVPLTMSVAASSLVQVKAGRLRALAVTTPQRSAVLPDVPTFFEPAQSAIARTHSFLRTRAGRQHARGVRQSHQGRHDALERRRESRQARHCVETVEAR